MKIYSEKIILRKYLKSENRLNRENPPQSQQSNHTSAWLNCPTFSETNILNTKNMKFYFRMVFYINNIGMM